MGLKTTVQNHSTLIELLQKLYPDSPQTRIKKILYHNNVVCNGKIITVHDTVIIWNSSNSVSAGGIGKFRCKDRGS